MKIKKGDTVLVTAGKDKGKKETVEKVLALQGKVLVIGVNQYKKHIKKNPVTGQGSEIVTITKPLPVSSVALICPKCKKQTRVGYKMEKATANGKKELKVRICRKCKKEI